MNKLRLLREYFYLRKRGEVALKLNARQKAFCEFYVVCGNATEAAIKAGYKEKNARFVGCENLTKANIKEYIEELQQKAQTSRIMSAIERREFLTKMILKEDAKDTDRLKALDILNKMDGEYTEKVQLSGELNTNPFKNLTTEELRKLAEDDG